MKNELTTSFKDELLSDLKQLAFVGIVKTKHAIGKRILQDWDKFGKPKHGSYGLRNLAKDMDVSYSEVCACVKFAKKFPEISDVSENLSWREVTQKSVPVLSLRRSSQTGMRL